MVFVRGAQAGERSCRTGAAGTFLSNALRRILRQLSNLCFHWRDLQEGPDNRYVADAVRSVLVQLEMAC